MWLGTPSDRQWALFTVLVVAVNSLRNSSRTPLVVQSHRMLQTIVDFVKSKKKVSASCGTDTSSESNHPRIYQSFTYWKVSTPRTFVVAVIVLFEIFAFQRPHILSMGSHAYRYLPGNSWRMGHTRAAPTVCQSFCWIVPVLSKLIRNASANVFG